MEKILEIKKKKTGIKIVNSNNVEITKAKSLNVLNTCEKIDSLLEPELKLPLNEENELIFNLKSLIENVQADVKSINNYL